MFSTKEVILILVAVIGVLALLLQTTGIITVDQFGIIGICKKREKAF